MNSIYREITGMIKKHILLFPGHIIFMTLLIFLYVVWEGLIKLMKLGLEHKIGSDLASMYSRFYAML